MKQKYYSLNRIKKFEAHYNLIFGERSNGKTYACLSEILTYYQQKGKQGAYIRRWNEDIKKSRMDMLFAGHVQNGTIAKMFKKEGWTDIYFYAGKFYLCNYDEDGKRHIDTQPFCFVFSLSAMEHDKSISYPNVYIIVFDEFLTRGMYLQNEYVLLMNVLSTIIRGRKGIVIYLLGNTVNKYSPYFDEFGLKHISKMKPGKIDLYEYGDSELKLACEYADSPSPEGKESDVYFAFDNPALKMIVSGEWETALYPHLQSKYKRSDVMLDYFVVFQDTILHCEVVYKDNERFTYVHKKTTDIKNTEDDLIFSFDDSPLLNHRRNMAHPIDETGKILYSHFVNGWVYYQDNDTGEIIRNYLIACRNDSVIK